MPSNNISQEINKVKLYTIQEAADELHCHPNTLRKWDKLGILSPFRIGKRKDRRYTQLQIDAILNKNNSLPALPKVVDDKIERDPGFKIALKDSNIVVYTQDRDLRYTWIYYSHPNFSPDFVVGKSDWDILTPETASQLIKVKNQVIQTGKPGKFELNIDVLGENRTYKVTIQPIVDIFGNVSGLAAVAEDKTEQKALEDKIRELQEKVTLLTKKLEKVK